MAEGGLAIRVPSDKRAISMIERTGYLPLHGRPRSLQIPGATVALVQEKGHVQLLARARTLVGPTKVCLVNGTTRPNGYRLQLSSIKRLRQPKNLAIRWRAVGQFRYFDADSWASTIVGPPVDRQRGSYLDDGISEPHGPRFTRFKFTGRILGLSPGDPESVLVRSYLAWLRATEEFEQHTFLRGRLCIDLFDPSRWRLIEAKVNADRQTLRSAVGQLLDYKRHYKRRPALGILLGRRPSATSIQYVVHCGVTAIWKTPSGRFGDSTQRGEWTRLRRRHV